MTDTLVLRVDDARRLLSAYRWRADAIATDLESLGGKLDRAAPFLGFAIDGGPAALVPRYLQALADQLNADHDDLAWRIAYVESLNPDALPPHLPGRQVHLIDVPITVLVAMLDGHERFDALQELAIRAAVDPDVAAAIAGRIDAEQVRDLTLHVEAEMLDVIRDHRFDTWRTTEHSEAYARTVDDVHALLDAYAIVLAGFSHEPAGRSALTDFLGLDDPDERILRLPMALHAGRWNEDFLVDLAERAFDGSGRPGPLVLGPSITDSIEGRQLFDRLGDPHAAILDALVRQPDAARRFMFDHDGFWRITADDDGYFGWFTAPTGHLIGDHLERARADLVRVTLADADFVDEAFVAMRGEYRPDEDRLNTGVLWTVQQRGEVDLALASALAEAWSMQWANITDVAGSQALSNSLGGDALAVLFEHEAAREIVLGSFAPFLETRFADAFRRDDPTALLDAIESVDVGFQLIDAGVDAIDPDETDRSVMRSAFGAGVGFLAKKGVAALALPSFPAAALLFVSGELAGTVADRLLADGSVTYPSSQELLEDLFVGGDAAPGALHRQPPLGEVALANAVLAAEPAVAAGLPPAPWLTDGVISPPTDLGELDRFGEWFTDAVRTNPDVRDRVVGTIDALAERAATYSDG